MAKSIYSYWGPKGWKKVAEKREPLRNQPGKVGSTFFGTPGPFGRKKPSYSIFGNQERPGEPTQDSRGEFYSIYGQEEDLPFPAGLDQELVFPQQQNFGLGGNYLANQRIFPPSEKAP